MSQNANEVIQTGDIVLWYKSHATSAQMPGFSVGSRGFVQATRDRRMVAIRQA